jgi:CspA family cold shock protein
MQLQGRIKHYRMDKGFGFVAPDDSSADLFFHIDDSPGIKGVPAAGIRVSYEIGKNVRDGRPRAINVQEVKSNAKPNPVRYGNDPQEWR